MTYDIAVIGAGPAGLSAASTAARAGARVVLVDDAERSGGQYWRHPRGGEPAHGARAHARLVKGLSRVDHVSGCRVWSVEAGRPFAVHGLVGARDARPTTITADTVIVATGAHDRVVPFPGWTLPGVVTAGAAQALWTGQGVVVDGPVVVAGTGPFLLPVATGLAAAGADVAGVWEANRPTRTIPGLAGAPLRVLESGGYAAALARRRIMYHTGRTVVAAHGDDRLEAVTVAALDDDWRPRPGTTRRIPCATLTVGHGFTPRLDLVHALGARLAVDAGGTARVEVSATQRTSVPGVYAAGEITGIGGAELGVVEGALAAHAATGTRPPGRLLTRRASLRRFADRLASVFRVGDGWTSWLDDDTIVCRCERVRAADVSAAVDAGGTDLRTVKLLSRAGMGPCQGRMCQSAVARLAGLDPAAEPPRRVVAQPIRLGDLAVDPTDPVHP